MLFFNKFDQKLKLLSKKKSSGTAKTFEIHLAVTNRDIGKKTFPENLFNTKICNKQV
jgi:hypothetical protein